MNKKDISKILASGTARQKYLLIAEDTARARHSLSRILTDAEVRALVDSIKTPQEAKVYNSLRAADRVIVQTIATLIYFRALYSKTIGNLDKLTLLWESYQNAEELVNFVLMEIKDPQERAEIAKRAAAKKNYNLVLHALDIDKDGYIRVDISDLRSKKHNLSMEEMLGTISKRALYELVEVKSLAQAMLDYMGDKGLSIKLYRDTIQEQIKLAMAEQSIIQKYNPTYKTTDGEAYTIKWHELLPQYKLYPDPETPPDPKRIAYFKNEILEANE